MSEPSPHERVSKTTLRRRAKSLSKDQDPSNPLLDCGRAHGNVTLTCDAAGRWTARGISTCGRVWECAYCAESRQLLRRASLRNSLAGWLARGRDVVQVTVTVPHSRSEDLADVLGLLDRARQKTLAGGARARLLGPHGVVAVDWTLEVTFDESHGWHPHLHMLFYLEAEVDDTGLDGLRADVASAWQKSVERAAGRTTWLSEHAVHVRRVDDVERAAVYLTKTPCGEDGAGQGGFALLAEYETHLSANQCSRSARCGVCRRLVALWREYTRAMQGKNRYYASPRTLAERETPSATRPRRSEGQRQAITVKREAWWLATRWEADDRMCAAARTDGIGGVRAVLTGLLVLEGRSPGDATAQAQSWAWEGIRAQARRRLLRSWLDRLRMRGGRVAARPQLDSPVPQQ